MDDISRELPPDSTGATPVSERQKGPEELARFERGLVDEGVDEARAEDHANPLERGGSEPEWGGRLAGLAMNLPGEPSSEDAPEEAPTPPRPSAEADGSESDSSESAQEAELPEEPAAEEHLSADSEAEADAQADAEADAETQPAAGDDATGDETGVDLAGDDLAGDDLAGDDLAGDDLAGDDLAEEDSAEEGIALGDSQGDEDSIDADEAVTAVAQEAHTASVQQDLADLDDGDLGEAELGEDGLPIVPELEDPAEIAKVIYVLMLTSREGMTVFRLAQACNTSQKLVEQALDVLQEQLRGLELPVELSRVGESVRWMSSARSFPYLQRLKGVKKLEKLSPAALETLAVIAYQQPVMRGEIESIRGVKAGPMLRTLLQHKLVKVTGRADVPGRPLQYGTTPQFLERFGLESLDELPSVKEWKNLG
ncbi:MAG: SMC-Scp complex subunit ScpB [Planctomycetota bacterium]